MSAGLAADVTVRLGGLDLDARFEVAPGETLAVLGPNGAGKTTLLRALAGLQPLERGSVHLDGDAMDDVASGTFVPPERRSVGFVFQDHLLFPHLDALDNVAFGLRCRGTSRRDARRRAGEWLERVGLAGATSARPHELSGGQAQRVALARALAATPRLLLLDEPLAALDASARPAMRRELRRHLGDHEGMRILVTHDPVEAAALASRLLVLEDGRVVQTGTAAEISRRPRSGYVADLVGVNLLSGRARDGRVALDGGFSLVIVDGPHVDGTERGDVMVVVHPRAVALHRHAPEGTARNVWETLVDGLDQEGPRVRVALGRPVPMVAEVTAAAVQELRLERGSGVWVSLKATEIAVFPA